VYDPNDDSIDSSNISITETVTGNDEEYFLVSKACVWNLLKDCPMCNQPCAVEIHHRIGTFVCIQQTCSQCEHSYKWNSQNFVQNLPCGNVLLAAAINFSGSSVKKALRVFDIMNVSAISNVTYWKYQTKYLQPTIWSLWQASTVLF
jgi:hypothetical protein